MRQANASFRHIIDVDGQLMGIEAATTDLATISALARLEADHGLFLVRDGARSPVCPHDIITLSEDEVLFFESSASRWMPVGWPTPAIVQLSS